MLRGTPRRIGTEPAARDSHNDPLTCSTEAVRRAAGGLNYKGRTWIRVQPQPDCASPQPGYHRPTKLRRSNPVSSDSMAVSTFLFWFLAVYVAAGLVTALAFVSFGVVRVLPQPAPVSIPARILLIPAAAALWPYVLVRWLRSR